MRRRSRTRWILKWVGLVGCGVLTAVWLGMLGRYVEYWSWDGRRHLLAVYMPPGGFGFRYEIGNNPRPSLSGHGWRSNRKPMFPTDGWLPRYGLAGKAWPNAWLYCPAWCLILVLAIPTGILWYRDRRPPRGHCQQCGYDLTGNVTGICPECGEPT